MPKLIGFDKNMLGKIHPLGNVIAYFTGYYQIEDASRAYWQVNTPQGTTWVKYNYIPANPTYTKAVDF